MDELKTASTPAGAGDGVSGAEVSGAEVSVGATATDTGVFGKLRLVAAAALFGLAGLAVSLLTPSDAPPAKIDAPPPELLPAAAPVDTPALQTPQRPKVSDSFCATPVREALPLADQMLLVGDLESCIAAYQQLQSRTTGIVHQRVTYRVGVVNELLGDLVTAQRTYQTLLEGPGPDSIFRAARLGQARIATAAGRFRTAQLQLAGDLLAGSDAAYDERRRAESAHLLAQCHAAEYLVASRGDLLLDTTLLVSHLPQRPAELLRLGDEPPVARQPDAVDDVPRVAIMHRFGQEPEKTQVQVNLPDAPLIEAVLRLARDTGLRAVVSESANRLAMHRQVSIRQKNTSLATLLDRLLTPMGIAWHQEGGLLHVASLEEQDPAAVATYQQDVALRALRQASIVYPEHHRVHVADLQLAMIHFMRGDLDESIQLYSRFLKHNPRSMMRREAWFNLAKAFLLAGQESSAIDAFYRVIDDGSQGEMAYVSYLYVGRLHLELDQCKRAAKPLRMALECLDPRIKSRAVVLLSSCYALQNNFAAATSVLAEYGQTIDEPAVRTVAELVSQFARFRAANAKRIEQAGTMLVGSLAHSASDAFLRTADTLVRSQAYRTLGLLKSQTAFLAQALPRTRAGAARQRIALALIATLVDLGELEEAADRIAEILPKMREPWRTRVRVKQVEVAYLQDETSRCLELCAKLIQDYTEYDVRSFALKKMGRIYHHRGHFEHASMCFAGILPPTTQDHARDATHGAVHPDRFSNRR